MAKTQILINTNTYTNMRQQPTNAQCEATYRTLIFSALVKNEILGKVKIIAA